MCIYTSPNIWLISIILYANAEVFECLDGCQCDTVDEAIHCHNSDRTEMHSWGVENLRYLFIRRQESRSTLPITSSDSRTILSVEIFRLPEHRLRGFMVLGLSNNNITRLPSEEDLKEKFPDLVAVDVEGNKVFDCNSTKEYKTIRIYSDCSGETTKIIRGNRLPDIEKPTAICDFQCQVQKHYQKLHDFVVRLWKELKAKYDEIDKEQLIAEVKEFFIKIANKIKNL